jgi:hypothetical protein
MTPQEIYDGFTDLLVTEEYLACGFPGQHTLITRSPLYVRGEITFREWFVFATPSVLLAMVHAVMRGEWFWTRHRPGVTSSFKVLTLQDDRRLPGDGQIHLVKRHYFEKVTSLIYISKTTVRPCVSLNLQGTETIKFLKGRKIQFQTQ